MPDRLRLSNFTPLKAVREHNGQVALSQQSASGEKTFNRALTTHRNEKAARKSATGYQAVPASPGRAREKAERLAALADPAVDTLIHDQATLNSIETGRVRRFAIPSTTRDIGTGIPSAAAAGNDILNFLLEVPDVMSEIPGQVLPGLSLAGAAVHIGVGAATIQHQTKMHTISQRIVRKNEKLQKYMDEPLALPALHARARKVRGASLVKVGGFQDDHPVVGQVIKAIHVQRVKAEKAHVKSSLWERTKGIVRTVYGSTRLLTVAAVMTSLLVAAVVAIPPILPLILGIVTGVSLAAWGCFFMGNLIKGTIDSWRAAVQEQKETARVNDLNDLSLDQLEAEFLADKDLRDNTLLSVEMLARYIELPADADGVNRSRRKAAIHYLQASGMAPNIVSALSAASYSKRDDAHAQIRASIKAHLLGKQLQLRAQQEEKQKQDKV